MMNGELGWNGYKEIRNGLDLWIMDKEYLHSGIRINLKIISHKGGWKLAALQYSFNKKIITVHDAPIKSANPDIRDIIQDIENKLIPAVIGSLINDFTIQANEALAHRASLVLDLPIHLQTKIKR